MFIDGIHTIKDDSIIDEDGTRPFTVPSHTREYSRSVGGATVWRRRRFDYLFKGSRLQPSGVLCGFTEHLMQRDDGDFKATTSTCDMTPEERKKVACYLNERPYLTYAETELDALRKRDLRAAEETYGKDAAKAAAAGNTTLTSLIAAQVNQALAGVTEQAKAKDAKIAELEAALASTTSGSKRPRGAKGS